MTGGRQAQARAPRSASDFRRGYSSEAHELHRYRTSRWGRVLRSHPASRRASPLCTSSAPVSHSGRGCQSPWTTLSLAPIGTSTRHRGRSGRCTSPTSHGSPVANTITGAAPTTPCHRTPVGRDDRRSLMISPPLGRKATQRTSGRRPRGASSGSGIETSQFAADWPPGYGLVDNATQADSPPSVDTVIFRWRCQL
jgi:hypothetical protein